MSGYYNNANPYYPTPFTPAVPDGLAQLRMGHQPPQQGMPGMIFVLGEAEAESYPVALGTTVVLWDRDTPTIFIKSRDASGIPSFRVLEWKDKPSHLSQTPQAAPADTYITRKEFEEWVAKFAIQNTPESEVINNG